MHGLPCVQFGTALGSVSRAFEKKNTQLEDMEEFVYNSEYGAWMPKSADPAKWAAENLAGPPPPPKAGGAPSGAAAGGTSNGGAVTGAAADPGPSAPHTPLTGASSTPGGISAPATGQLSAMRPGANRGRGATRARYVDTFNTGDADAPAEKTDSELMPPPAARPAKPKPTFFTPQRPAGAGSDADGAAGGATPLFMTPTADVYAGLQQPSDDIAPPDALPGAPPSQ